MPVAEYEDELEEHFGDSYEWAVDQVVVRREEYNESVDSCCSYDDYTHQFTAHSVELTEGANLVGSGAVAALLLYYAPSHAIAKAAAGGLGTWIVDNNDGTNYTFGGLEHDSSYDCKAGFDAVVAKGWKPDSDETQWISHAPGHPARL